MLTEAELVEELGVSRSNVREAVRTLVALDILDVRHGTGTFVGEMSMRPLVDAMIFRGEIAGDHNASLLEEIVEVRMGLDQALAPRVLERLAGADTAPLQECVREINESAQRGANFADVDRRFHLLLAKELGNSLYSQLVAAFWDIHMAITPSFKAEWHDIKATAAAHERMLAAALAGDLESYETAVFEHYEPLLKILGEQRKLHIENARRKSQPDSGEKA